GSWASAANGKSAAAKSFLDIVNFSYLRVEK
ncbi:MAG: hypothetical protein ACI9LG_003279, partial [Moritella dasanensis]